MYDFLNCVCGSQVLTLRWLVVTAKQANLGLTRELFFSSIIESTTSYTFIPCVGYFTSTGIGLHQIEARSLAFSVSFERHKHMQKWGERNCLCFETAIGGI